MYVVDTWEKAEEKIIELQKGNDPLKEAREKMIEKLMGKDFLHITDRIINEFVSDSRK